MSASVVIPLWNVALFGGSYQLWRSLRDKELWPIAVYDRYSSPVGYWIGIWFCVYAVAFLIVGDFLLGWAALSHL